MTLSTGRGPHLGLEFGTDFPTLPDGGPRRTGLTDIAEICVSPTPFGDRDGQRAPAFAKVFGR